MPVHRPALWRRRGNQRPAGRRSLAAETRGQVRRPRARRHDGRGNEDPAARATTQWTAAACPVAGRPIRLRREEV